MLCTNLVTYLLERYHTPSRLHWVDAHFFLILAQCISTLYLYSEFIIQDHKGLVLQFLGEVGIGWEVEGAGGGVWSGEGGPPTLSSTHIHMQWPPVERFGAMKLMEDLSQGNPESSKMSLWMIGRASLLN